MPNLSRAPWLAEAHLKKLVEPLTPSSRRLLDVTGLSVQFPTGRGVVRAVDRVNLQVDEGEIVGLVGESGCGKSVLTRSLLRLVPEPGRIVGGRIAFRGQDVLGMGEEQLRNLRGGDLAAIPQDAMSALNPLTRVAHQVAEAITAHSSLTGRAAEVAAVEKMVAVQVPDAQRRASDFPHQFSGGMRQRLLLAMGVANRPGLLLADEPTTSLDVIAQAKVLRSLADLNREFGTAILLVSHNLAAVANLCQRILVMYAGRIIEEGPVEQIVAQPQHPYTWYLLRSLAEARAGPKADEPILQGLPPDMAQVPTGCTFHPRCAFKEERCADVEPPLEKVSDQQRARCWVLMRSVDVVPSTSTEQSIPLPAPSLHHEQPVILQLERVTKRFPTGEGQTIPAVIEASLTLRKGEVVGLIGESGCGKSTLARLVGGLLPLTSGQVFLEGRDITGLRHRELRDVRRRMQIVFQDPLASLDSRMRVKQLVREPLDNLGILRRSQRPGRTLEMLELVGLGPGLADRYPHQLSGGQRQRVGIARALVVEPTLLICDEPTSALDVPVQAQILDLIFRLRDMFGLTCLFISHDLGVVRSVVERVAVMYLGRIVELSDAGDLYRDPLHPYTTALLDAADHTRHRGRGRELVVLQGETTSGAHTPSGCCLHPRCPIAHVPGVCDTAEPVLLEHDGGPRSVACHLATQRTS